MVTTVLGAEDGKLLDRGRETYEVHCSNCHGLTGEGDGDLAKLLRVPPSDLRKIRLAYDGEFPRAELYRIIDGRRPVKGHGSPEMPVWGISFQERGLDVNQEDMIRGRILQVLMFLESIQVDEKGRPWVESEAEEQKSRKEGKRTQRDEP